MSGSVVVETALGLVFVFLVASLVCTGVVEYISKCLNKRGEYLLRGLREMLDIPPSAPSADSGEAEPPSENSGLLGDRKKLGQTGATTRGEIQRLSKVGATLGDDLEAATGPSPHVVHEALSDLVLSHPLVATLHRPSRPGRAWIPGQPKDKAHQRGHSDMHLASYVSSRTFAKAVIDLFVPSATGTTSIDVIRQNVQKLDKGIPGRDVLLVLLRDAEGSLERFRVGLEEWYDEQMARVSGWYRRWAQWRLFVVGALLAVLFNISTVDVARTLYRDEPVRTAVVASALSAEACPAAEGKERETCLADQQRVLRELPLPFGWGLQDALDECRGEEDEPCVWPPGRGVDFLWESLKATGFLGALLSILGWLMTAAAVSFGAPFWFDALNKIGSLRIAGKRPQQSSRA